MEHFRHGDEIDIIKVEVNPFLKYMPVYVYYMDGLLVDTGPRIRKNKLSPIYEKLDIKEVAITHYHSDHTGMASWIMEHKQPKILCSKKTLEIIQNRSTLSTFEKLFSKKFEATPFNKVVKTNKYEFYPIETPGHTPDHTALFEPNKGWLFTGDLYISPYPRVSLREESISSYIESLFKLQKLDFNTVFCGHEGVIKDGRRMLEKKLLYLQKTQAEVIRLHKLGYNDREIRQKVFPEKVRLEIVTLGSFSRLNFIRSCYKGI